MVRLQYRGKKVGRTLDLPQLTEPVPLQNQPIVVNEADAAWLMENNPSMFHNLGFVDAGYEEPAPVDGEKPEEPVREPVGTCPKCEKEYFAQWAFDKHIARCEGPEEET